MHLFRFTKRTKGIIFVNKSRAYAKEPNKKYGYSLARMIIGKIDPKTGVISSFSGDVMENDREIAVESVFEEGDYAVYLEIEWA